MFEISAESDKVRKKFINEVDDEVKQINDIWPNINLQTTDNKFECYLKEDYPQNRTLFVFIALMKTMWKHVRKSKF